MRQYTISEAAAVSGASPDTLRYYEKIELLPAPPRTAGGRRAYRDIDIARLRFARRAQSIGFSLNEIKQLLKLRERPQRCARTVRALAERKCQAMSTQIAALEQMRGELILLLNLCRGDTDECPILDRLDGV